MATNKFGFDFLRSEHRLDEGGESHDAYGNGSQFISDHPVPVLDSAVPVSAHLKPDLEKQFDILAFLQKHRGSGSALAPSLIYRSTGIHLETDTAVAQMLQSNPKVRTEFIPDPENPSLQVAHYAYQAKYPSVRDRASLLAQVNRMHNGVPVRDLEDSYAGIEDDIETLICGGEVIAVQNTEDKDKILFPRGEAFLVELDGLLSLPESSASVNNNNNDSSDMPPPVTNPSKKSPKMAGDSSKRKSPKFEPNNNSSDRDNSSTTTDDDQGIFGILTDVDPQKQIRRGEAISIGGQWFRVSSAIKHGESLRNQPARAQAPLSVVSRDDPFRKNEGYIRPFHHKHSPLDHAVTETAQQNIRQARQARETLLKLGHGRSSVTGQLTGSYAHASNPTTLAGSLAASSAPNLGSRKVRPTASTNSSSKLTMTFGVSGDARHAASSEAALLKAALEEAASDPALALYSHARRHGCTLDVRAMYLATRASVPSSDEGLRQTLLQHKLLEPGEEMRRPRLTKSGTNVDNDGKPKKRRYYERKNQRMTNTHLEGTEIGALLHRAAEKQKQGKSVGDGGM